MKKFEGFTFDGMVDTHFGEIAISIIVISYLKCGGKLPEKYFGEDAEKFQKYLTEIGVEGNVIEKSSESSDAGCVFEFILSGKVECEDIASSILND